MHQFEFSVLLGVRRPGAALVARGARRREKATPSLTKAAPGRRTPRRCVNLNYITTGKRYVA
jgi:hypothetical protein